MFSKSLEICREGGPTGNTWVMQKSWSLSHFWTSGTLPNSIFWQFLPPYFCKWSPNDLKFSEKLLLNEIRMIQFLHLWHALKKVIFLNFFLNFQVKFTFWRWHQTEIWQKIETFSSGFQMSNWLCSSTLGKCSNRRLISRVLKMHYLRERNRFQWSPFPEK